MGLFKSNEKIIAEKIMDVYHDGIFNNNEIKYEKNSLSIKINASELEKHNGTVMSKAFYTVMHPLFDEPITEPGVGVGKNTKEALLSSAQGFIGVAASIFASLGCTYASAVKSTATDREIVFKKPCISPIIRMGNADEKMVLWNALEDIIPEYLGTKKAYWIKIFAAVSNNEPVFEVRINNTEYSDISRTLAERVGNVFVGEEYISQKEFILLIREEPAESRFSAEQVKNYADTAINIFMMYSDMDPILDIIYKICGDKTLTYELGFFIPEIYTAALLNISEPDDVYIREKPVKRSVIRDYGYIETAVRDYICKNRPSNKENLHIMAFGSKLNAINKALEQGAKIEQIKFSKMCYSVPEDYEIR